MNDKRLQHLFAAARSEMSPRVDVADRVIAALRGSDALRTTAGPHPLAWIAATSSLAASAVSVMAWFSWHASLDPLAEILYLAGGLL